MGSSNYHHVNVLYTIDDEEEEFTWNDTRHNVEYELKDNSNFYVDSDIKIETELRSFPATSIGSIELNLEYLDLDIDIKFTLMARTGYYQGFNLDYEIDISSSYSHFDDVSDYLDDVDRYEETDYIGLFKAHRKSLESKLNKLVLDTHNEICRVYEMYSDRTEVIATFSNGETIYSKAS